MNVTLTPETKAIVDRLVESGRYSSEREALAAAIRLLDEEERAIAVIQSKIQEGVNALDRGDFYSLEEVAATLQRDQDEQFGT